MTSKIIVSKNLPQLTVKLSFSKGRYTILLRWRGKRLGSYIRSQAFIERKIAPGIDVFDDINNDKILFYAKALYVSQKSFSRPLAQSILHCHEYPSSNNYSVMVKELIAHGYKP